MDKKKKPTIDELERILDGPPPCIEIMPDGSLKAKKCSQALEKDKKILALELALKEARSSIEEALPTLKEDVSIHAGTQDADEIQGAVNICEQALSSPLKTDLADALMEEHEAMRDFYTLPQKMMDKPAWEELESDSVRKAHAAVQKLLEGRGE